MASSQHVIESQSVVENLRDLMETVSVDIADDDAIDLMVYPMMLVDDQIPKLLTPLDQNGPDENPSLHFAYSLVTLTSERVRRRDGFFNLTTLLQQLAYLINRSDAESNAEHDGNKLATL
ncbi:hypothetical protein PRIPAC_72853 [Pristionchus pacificus]|uniref:Uncharacterized protein n=1 Tax=Pristionchus pacificus TaxID=54126 RepID=A0A2A6CRW4_PRIPA|nr:hypothetical protein PRIPAC_72853 [Pristionchus pacificus]|eukprot:PDM80945.1 hypothetical protein PRIPAC_35948 [Pristionchus pacificus]